MIPVVIDYLVLAFFIILTVFIVFATTYPFVDSIIEGFEWSMVVFYGLLWCLFMILVVSFWYGDIWGVVRK